MARNPWYVVEINFTARSGKIRKTRSKAFPTREDARKLEREYEQTGHTTRIVEVPAPAAKPTRHERIDAAVLPLPGVERSEDPDPLRALRGRK